MRSHPHSHLRLAFSKAAYAESVKSRRGALPRFAKSEVVGPPLSPPSGSPRSTRKEVILVDGHASGAVLQFIFENGDVQSVA